MEPTRILIVDDHLMFIEGIKASLSHEPEISVTGCARNGEEALSLIANNEYDLVLLDINMPKLGGVETCRKIRGLHPELKVLALTMHSEHEHIRAMIEAGASGYVIKNVEPHELVRAIQKVAGGEMYFSSDVAVAMMGNFLSRDTVGPGRKENTQSENLSKREIEIIKLIAKEMTSAQIAGTLFISETTVETHRRNILHKLGVKSSVGIIKYAVSHDLL